MDKEKREQERLKAKSRFAQTKLLILCSLQEPRTQKAMLLATLSLIIAFLLTPSFTIDTPQYRLGDIAERNIRAKRDCLIEDQEATTRKRDEAVRQVPVVYDLDESVGQAIQKKLDTAFQAVRNSLSQTASSDAPAPSPPSQAPSPAASPAAIDLSNTTQQRIQKKKNFEGLIGFQIADTVFSTLLDRQFSQTIEDRIGQLIRLILDQGVVASKAWLLRAQNEDLVLRKAGTQEEFLLPPPHGYLDVEEARKTVRMQAIEQGGNPKEIKAVVALATQLLQPNISLNAEETERRRAQAYASVKPVFIQLVRNEMMVREGQKIGPEELLKLKAHEQEKPGQHRAIVFLAMFLFTIVSVWVVVHVARRHVSSYRMDLPDYLFLGMLLVFLLMLGRSAEWIADLAGESSALITNRAFIYALPLSAGAMMVSVFFGVTVSLIFSLLLTLFAGMLFGKDFGLFFYFLIGSFVGAHSVSPCRNRMIPIKAGLLVGCTNVVLIVLSALLQDQLMFVRTVVNMFFGLCGGVFAGILVVGFTPLAEMACNYTTDFRLLELATMDQPLLQELMVQAPGTYHHSIIVGNMVEAASKAIGANALLAKVAAYYHDIGKIKKPLYFIENQFDCENRHEKLAPSMSSLILISHVKDGIELARNHRLGNAITDIISQHHGTSFISFFYKKAIEAREKAILSKGAELPPINGEDYRYPGPKPQTKEAGLVMLADVVEAACRSLTEPTPARIQGMVNRLINNIFSDGQLEECELTLKDLHHIAKRFNQILATVHHKRVEYPSTSPTNGKVKTDGSDAGQRESKPDRDKPSANREGGKPDLKRLGIH